MPTRGPRGSFRRARAAAPLPSAAAAVAAQRGPLLLLAALVAATAVARAGATCINTALGGGTFCFAKSDVADCWCDQTCTVNGDCCDDICAVVRAATAAARAGVGAARTRRAGPDLHARVP